MVHVVRAAGSVWRVSGRCRADPGRVRRHRSVLRRPAELELPHGWRRQYQFGAAHARDCLNLGMEGRWLVWPRSLAAAAAWYTVESDDRAGAAEPTAGQSDLVRMWRRD